MSCRALPANELLQVEVEAQVQAILYRRSLADAAEGIAAHVCDVGEAVLDALILQDGPEAERITKGTQIRLHRADVAAGGLARRLGLSD